MGKYKDNDVLELLGNENQASRFLVNASLASKLMSVSLSHFHALNNQGKIPAPRKLGRRSLWSVKELEAWVAAGCPNRMEWQQRGASQ